MDKEKIKRHESAVYTLILLAAIILFLLGTYVVGEGTFHDVLISLSANLVGIAAIFFIVNRYFLLGNQPEVDIDHGQLPGNLKDEFASIQSSIKSINRDVSELSREIAVGLTDQQKQLLEATVTLRDDKPDDLNSKIENAEEICLIGLNLRFTTINHFENFKAISRRGGNVRALIADPYKTDISVLLQRFGRGQTTEKQFMDAFEYTISQYNKLQCLNEQDPSIKDDAVQLKALDFVPPYSLYLLFPKAREEAVAVIEIYAFDVHPGSRPKFEVSKQRNPAWFEFFVSQFEKMWTKAHPIKHDPDSYWKMPLPEQ